MILVDGEKYSCVQCIRGHRSSTCKHSARPLVQVRSRGRPSLAQTHRIAVTESEIVLSRNEVTIQDSIDDKTPKKQNTRNVNPKKESVPIKKSCCSGKAKSNVINPADLPKNRSCCSNAKGVCACNNKNGVILLKASKRQFVDVKDGNLDFVGPYNGSSISSFKVENPRLKKPRATPHVNHLKLLKTVKVNEVNYNFNANAFNTANSNNETPYITPSSSSSSSILNSKANNGPGFPPPELEKAFQDFQLSSLQNTRYPHLSPYYSVESKDHIQLPPLLNPIVTQNQAHSPQVFDMMLASGCADECNCGPDCSCPGCLIHRTNEELKDYGILDNSSTTVSTPSDFKGDNNDTTGPVDANTSGASVNTITNPQQHVDLINFETIDELLLQEILEDNCICEAEECRCYNCLEHGISEGIRLSDGVNVTEEGASNVSSSTVTGDSTESAPSSTNKDNNNDNNEYDHDCGCSPEECACYNCVKHGIYNGVRMNQEQSKVSEPTPS